MAFLDRLHFYLPGWEVPKMRIEYFTDHYGFVTDYLTDPGHNTVVMHTQFKATAPAVGETIDTEEGRGRVVNHDVPRDQVIVRLEDCGTAEYIEFPLRAAASQRVAGAISGQPNRGSTNRPLVPTGGVPRGQRRARAGRARAL